MVSELMYQSYVNLLLMYQSYVLTGMKLFLTVSTRKLFGVFIRAIFMNIIN